MFVSVEEFIYLSINILKREWTPCVCISRRIYIFINKHIEEVWTPCVCISRRIYIFINKHIEGSMDTLCLYQ